MKKINTVKQLWHMFSKAEYREAESLLDKNLFVIWPTSREKYQSREQFILVNEAFGDGWAFDLLNIEETVSGKVNCVCYVHSPDCKDSFYASSIIEFQGNCISRIETYWAFQDKQSEWRKELSEVY